MQDTILRLCASTALIGALAFPATAQQIINLEEITFSANLIESEILRSGSSVSVVTRDEIESSGAVQIADILQRLPGLSIVRSGGPGASADLRLRGAPQRYVAVYVDGIRIDDPTGTSVQTDFGHLSVHDIDRIEVLRGSQSALYGGSAVAGVINISSRRALEDGLTQSARIEAGSHDTYLGSYSMGFRDDRLEATLSISHQRSRGFTSWEGLPGTPGYSPDAEADGFQSSRVSFATRYQATDTVALGVAVFFQNSRNDYDGFMDPEADLESRRRQTGLRLSAEFDTGAVQHEVALTGYRIDRDEFSDGAFSNGFEGRRIGLAYQGRVDLSPALTFIWGADTERETSRAQTLLGGSESTRTTGAYLQTLYAPTDTLNLGATVRVDGNSTFGTFMTGRANFAWQVSPAVTLRGAVARGFRAPALDERSGNYPGTFPFVGNPALEPETSVSAEIGADYRLGNGAEFSATLFQLTTDNLITFAPGTPSTLENLPGKSKRRGVELAASVPVNDALRLSANYTYTDARNPSGARLTRVPRHDAFLGLDGQVAEDFGYNLGLQYVAGRPDEFGTPFKDYTVANATFRYAINDRADLYLRIDNLFDRNYQEVANYKTSGRAIYLGVASRF